MNINLRHNRRVIRMEQCAEEQATSFVRILWDGTNGEPVPMRPVRRIQGRAVNRAMRKLRRLLNAVRDQ